jgi:hypothetical protein
MKNAFIRALFSSLVIMLATLGMVSCETSQVPKKKKAAPPPGTGEYSNLGWNRPQKWEGASRFGGAVPQSR